MNESLHVYVIDDDPSSLQSMGALLKAHGYAFTPLPSAEAFLALDSPEPYSCLLLDIRMAGMSGLELQERLLSNETRHPVIILTGHGDIPAAVRAMRMGAIDFIEKPAPVSQLLEGLAAATALVHTGQPTRRVPSPEVTRRLALLTPRERQVTERMLLGETSQTIADRLAISRRTVEVHRARVRKKLDVRGLADLIRLLR